jgi:hypothetical protein
MHFLLGAALVVLPLWGFTAARIPIGIFTLDLFTLFIALAAGYGIAVKRKISFGLSLVDIFVLVIF